MPGGDSTGPMGMGPMTGRAAGYCAGNTAGGFASAGARGFRGGGRGRRRGRRNRHRQTQAPEQQQVPGEWSDVEADLGRGSSQMPPSSTTTMSREQQLDILKRQADGCVSTLDQLKQRIAELEAQSQEE